MRRSFASAAAVLLVFLAFTSLCRADAALDALATKAARDAIEQFKDDKIKESEIAVTVIDLHDAANPRSGSFRGDQPMFPASVVKLFYLVATHQWLEDGKLADSEELRRTMSDMIVDSSNDATAMIVDSLSDAINGPPLPDAEMKQWIDKRNAVNRYFASLGYTVGGTNGINVNQKTYCEGPYGREKLFIGSKFENRNRLTTDATANLLSSIVLGKAVTAQRSRQMMDLLKRDPTSKAEGPDDQDTGFTAAALPPGAKLWSKAGWTNTARHDSAYVELEDGTRVIVVTFTANHSRQRKLIPAVARAVLEGLRTAKPG
jgi:beta-lactamase class A